VLGARPSYKSSLEIFVVKIDEQEASMVTWEYVTPGRYVVYNMELGHYA